MSSRTQHTATSAGRHSLLWQCVGILCAACAVALIVAAAASYAYNVSQVQQQSANYARAGAAAAAEVIQARGVENLLAAAGAGTQDVEGTASAAGADVAAAPTANAATNAGSDGSAVDNAAGASDTANTGDTTRLQADASTPDAKNAVGAADAAAYQATRAALRDLCQNFNLEYLYVYVPNQAAGTVTYLAAAAADDAEDTAVTQQRPAGCVVEHSLTSSEAAAWAGSTTAGYYTEDNAWGSVYTWSWPLFDSSGAVCALIACDYQADLIASRVAGQTLVIMVPVFVVLAFVCVALFLFLNRQVFAPVRRLAGQMRNFVATQQGGEGTAIAPETPTPAQPQMSHKWDTQAQPPLVSQSRDLRDGLAGGARTQAAASCNAGSLGQLVPQTTGQTDEGRFPPLAEGAHPQAATQQATSPLSRTASPHASAPAGGNEIAEIGAAFDKMSADVARYISHIERLTAENTQGRVQMDVAHRIQCGIVPARLSLSGAGWQARAFARPARQVGGDFYDCFTRADGSVCALIGDVSGKGISAALFMVMCKTMLHDALAAGKSPACALNEANAALCAANPELMFCTAFAAVLVPQTGQLTFANAGHNPPVLSGGEGAATAPTAPPDSQQQPPLASQSRGRGVNFAAFAIPEAKRRGLQTRVQSSDTPRSLRDGLAGGARPEAAANCNAGSLGQFVPQTSGQTDEGRFPSLAGGACTQAAGQQATSPLSHEPQPTTSTTAFATTPTARFLQVESGTALGLFEDASISERTVALTAGATLTLYTDGVTEAINAQRQFFGEGRLLDALAAAVGAAASMDALTQASADFTGAADQFDDYTVLSLTRTAAAPNDGEGRACAAAAPETAHTTTDTGAEIATSNTDIAEIKVKTENAAEIENAADVGCKHMFTPNISELPRLRELIYSALPKNFDKKKAFMAAEEAFANIVNYSQASKIIVEITPFTCENAGAITERISIAFTDDGTAFDPLAFAPSTDDDFEQMEFGGMGIGLIKRLAESATYSRRGGRNCLKLTFKTT